ncbi:LytTR family DNA-binding domain-containing protein [Faecalicatena sp. AGMB00832]|uniref:LytTR family DNA-binding domain-containing protein n=1 Tax=Faecalicatena faecalis TaxID=2726362 RepID=A0ABS6D1X6_9FIRM|nr:LytTR family DNA-binding domain-containing protein [Faecalicatena faecalis]MBU3875421.1 LytTR family DNA-binding domain-containing protein [Faecalicatena faecalis]
MLRIAICDDEQEMTTQVKRLTALYFRTHCKETDIVCYQLSENLLYDLTDGIFFDLLLLDIEMPGVNGMDLAETIQNKIPGAKIIFITSHLEYAITAYEFSVFRYIPKSMMEEKLPLALEDYFKLYSLERNDYYTVKVKNYVRQIPYRDILYILKDGKYAVLYLANDETIAVRRSLNQIYDEMKKEYLYFADRGCIINLANVVGMDDTGILFQNNRSVCISKAGSSGFKNAMLEFWEGLL